MCAPLGIVRKNQKQLSKETEMEMWYLSGEIRVRLNKMESAPMLENPLMGKWCSRPLSVFWETWTKGVLSPSCGRRRVSFRSHLFLRPSSTSWQPSWIKVFIRFMKESENHSLASVCSGGLPLAGVRKAGPRRSAEFLLALRRSPTHVGRSCLFCVFGIKYSVACISPPSNTY